MNSRLVQRAWFLIRASEVLAIFPFPIPSLPRPVPQRNISPSSRKDTIALLFTRILQRKLHQGAGLRKAGAGNADR